MLMTVNIACNALAALPDVCRDDWKIDDSAALMPVVFVSKFLAEIPQLVHIAQVV